MKTELGDLINHTDTQVFFGRNQSSSERLSSAFPELELIQLNQTHSNIVVHSPNATADCADAHFTRELNVALCIRTADCMPIFLHDPVTGLIAAIHAGWRGIENEIILKTMDRLKTEGADLEKSFVWIGPHVQAASFVVGQDVADRLDAAFKRSVTHQGAGSPILVHDEPGKVRVDLLKIARAQLDSRGLHAERVKASSIDTVLSERHCSYRRDHERAGRQLSFIATLEPISRRE